MKEFQILDLNFPFILIWLVYTKNSTQPHSYFQKINSSDCCLSIFKFALRSSIQKNVQFNLIFFSIIFFSFFFNAIKSLFANVKKFFFAFFSFLLFSHARVKIKSLLVVSIWKAWKIIDLMRQKNITMPKAFYLFTRYSQIKNVFEVSRQKILTMRLLRCLKPNCIPNAASTVWFRIRSNIFTTCNETSFVRSKCLNSNFKGNTSMFYRISPEWMSKVSYVVGSTLFAVKTV